MENAKKNRIGLLLLGIVLVVAAALAIPGILASQRQPGERNTSSTLKTIASAQAEFRANDRDGDGKQEFWLGDIAGLYGLKGRDGQPIQLIELSAALADDRPSVDLSAFGKKNPKSGHWYRAIRHQDTKVQDPARFAACGFPADYPAVGKYTYIISEDNTIFIKDLGHGRGITLFPTADELKTWKKLD